MYCNSLFFDIPFLITEKCALAPAHHIGHHDHLRLMTPPPYRPRRPLFLPVRMKMIEATPFHTRLRLRGISFTRIFVFFLFVSFSLF